MEGLDPYSDAAVDPSSRSIRLFRLLSTTRSGVIIGEFRVFDLDSCPRYTALSYTWGAAQPKKEILIGGRSFIIRDNLWHFLQQSAATDEGRWLWIDAVCIDQSNISERNHQVSLMRDIYSTARSVTIWLGQATIESNMALDYLDTIHDDTDDSASKPMWSQRQGQAILDLFQTNYWRRVWIVQEIMLAKRITVICGTKEIDWSRLAALVIHLRTLYREGQISHQTHATDVLASDAVRLIEGKMAWPEVRSDEDVVLMGHLLRTYHDMESTDTHDKVYGFFGLLKSATEIPVDYAMSIPQVYTESYFRLQASYGNFEVEARLDLAMTLRDILRLDPLDEAVMAAEKDARSKFDSQNTGQPGSFVKRVLPTLQHPNTTLGQPYFGQTPFDTTGQIRPRGMKPRVTATLWEDEGSLCFQVEANGVCVARREDNHMINGTKLLTVAGMTRGSRDSILKSEKTRHVVKMGPIHLKGVWIPYDRALDFANKEEITDILYPLFVHNIGALFYHP